MRVGKALNALGGALADDLHIGRAGKPLRYMLKVLLLVRVGVVAVMLPVHPSGKIGEILRVVLERIVFLDVELPIVDEIVSGGGAGIENDLRKIALVDADLRPDGIFGDQPDQAVAIGHHEIHACQISGVLDASTVAKASRRHNLRGQPGSFSAAYIARVSGAGQSSGSRIP